MSRRREMTLNEYQQLAARTIDKTRSEEDIEKHALLGLSSEVGELLGLYQKEMQGHEFNVMEAIEEAGDVLWMLSAWCTANGIHLQDVAVYNEDKRRKRYPNGFDPARSVRR